jgi:hypothetical protein
MIGGKKEEDKQNGTVSQSELRGTWQVCFYLHACLFVSMYVFISV